MAEDLSRPDGEAPARDDIDHRAVLRVAAAILVTLALVAAGCRGLLRLKAAPLATGPERPLDFGAEPPRLQAAPQPERAAYFAEKERLLHSYAWIDRQAGTARIPIEAAMELLAAREGG